MLPLTTGGNQPLLAQFRDAGADRMVWGSQLSA